MTCHRNVVLNFKSLEIRCRHKRCQYVKFNEGPDFEAKKKNNLFWKLKLLHLSSWEARLYQGMILINLYMSLQLTDIVDLIYANILCIVHKIRYADQFSTD